MDELYTPQSLTVQSIGAQLPPSVVDVLTVLFSQLPPSFLERASSWQVMAEPMQVHAVALAVFASFIAPFGAHPY